MPVRRSDSTYEGLKRVILSGAGRAEARSDSTYEGLKLPQRDGQVLEQELFRQYL